MGVVIIDSGSGNLRTVARALQAGGARPQVTADPEVARRADTIVVPGQGAFGACVERMRERGFDQVIREHVQRDRPYLGICLGLQILFELSEESEGQRGLGILGGRVRRFDAAVGKVPHMGWNQVRARRPEPLMDGIDEGSHFYFIHSYYVEPAEAEIAALSCHYGHDFTAALRRGALFACQFHPEKSQRVGLRLLQNFLEQSP